VRLGMLRRAHQRLGYDALAFEGSPEDVWTSQDALLQSPGDTTNSTSGLFPLWNTDEFAKSLHTSATPGPQITRYTSLPMIFNREPVRVLKAFAFSRSWKTG